MTSPTHLDPAGRARMVDVSDKAPSRRVARASGAIRMSRGALTALMQGELPKGDAFAVARVAGIQAAKRTPDLVPLCHPLPIDHVSIEVEADENLPGVKARSEVVVTARTGAEMEALVAVTGALLSIYDMAKSLDRGMTIEEIRLESKAGGRSRDWSRGEEAGPSARGPALVATLVLLFACGGDPAPDARAGGAADSAPAFVADTQLVIDSLGNEIMIVSKRTAHLLPSEVRPRAGAGDPAAPDAWRVVEARSARSLMQAARPPWYVIDVRDSRAFATRGHLPGAALVPIDLLEENVGDLHVRNDQIVLLYADDEARAIAAARILASYGFPHLRVLGGGLGAWDREGLPVEGR